MPEGETRLTSTLCTLHNLHRSERAGERRRSSREGWLTTESDSINLLQLASLDVDVNDAIIMISGRCTKLVYGPYGDHVTWFLVPLFSRNLSAYYSQRNFRIMCTSLMELHAYQCRRKQWTASFESATTKLVFAYRTLMKTSNIANEAFSC